MIHHTCSLFSPHYRRYRHRGTIYHDRSTALLSRHGPSQQSHSATAHSIRPAPFPPSISCERMKTRERTLRVRYGCGRGWIEKVDVEVVHQRLVHCISLFSYVSNRLPLELELSGSMVSRQPTSQCEARQGHDEQRSNPSDWQTAAALVGVIVVVKGGNRLKSRRYCFNGRSFLSAMNS